MGKRVLLVADDVEMNRKVIKKFLQSDFDVLEAEDGQIAMDILESKKVDALLLDIIMPNLDGLEVLKRLKADPKYDNLAILVATSTKEKTERKALSLGADDIVSKPYDPLVILKRLDNIRLMKQAGNLKDTQTPGVEYENLVNQLKDSMKRVHMLADVIEQSTENKALLDKMVADLHKEADKLLAAVSSDAEGR